MVRIGGGVFPEIKEKDYLGEGQYRIDSKVTKVSGSDEAYSLCKMVLIAGHQEPICAATKHACQSRGVRAMSGGIGCSEIVTKWCVVSLLHAQTMSDSLMYRLSYYRFAEGAQYATGQRGFDRVRNTHIGLQDFKCGLGCSWLAC